MGTVRGQPNSNCNGYIHSDSHCHSNVHTYPDAYAHTGESGHFQGNEV